MRKLITNKDEKLYNIFHRLRSIFYFDQLLFEKFVECYKQIENNILKNKPFNQIIIIKETEINFIFESIIFNTVSLFDYLVVYLRFKLKIDDSKIKLEEYLLKNELICALNKISIKYKNGTSNTLEEITYYNYNFIKQFRYFRNKIIHNNKFECRCTLLNNSKSIIDINTPIEFSNAIKNITEECKNCIPSNILFDSIFESQLDILENALIYVTSLIIYY
jgi:hypothetical protein